MSPAARLRELTARGRGAIRVLALEGEGARDRLAALVAAALAPGTFARVWLREPDGAPLDEAIVLVESAERVELHLHGSPALVERVRALLALPEPEDPPSSLEERAEQCLEHAASEPAARLLLAQVEGALRAEYERLLAGGDEELVLGARELARRGQRARRLLTPPRVVLAGPVNAGKSTLFNLLVGRARVVVSPVPGTTRDVVHERVRLGSLVVDLFDTAGERVVSEPDSDAGREATRVERAGQALAREWRASADLVLWLAPAQRAEPWPEAERVRVLHTLADLDPERARRAHPSLSVLAAPEEARAIVARVVEQALGGESGSWAPGAAVPFESEQVETLARAATGPLRRALAAWLAAGRPAAPVEVTRPLA